MGEIRSFESKCKKAFELIGTAKKITLLTHYKPDGDGVSACVALELFLKKLGKKIESIYPTPAEFEFKRQPKKLFIGEHHQIPDLIIIADTANYERVYFSDEFKKIPMINIDHHISNSIKGTVNFINADASSACEVLFEVLKCWDASLIDKKIAEALLFGILYDSRVFHTQATYPETLRVAAHLIDLGANLFELKCELLANRDPNIIKLWGLVIERVKVSKDNKAAWTYIMQDDLKKNKLTLTSIIGFNDFLSDISGIDVTLLFYENEEGQTKVSLRSKTYDVNHLAAKFGGGGHTNASGILSPEPLEKLMKKVVAAI